MNIVELKKMVIDTALSNLKNELHYIIDRIAADKAFDQYNAKCGEVERLREALQTADETLIEINLSNYGMDDVDRLNNSSIEASQIIRAALQPKEGEK